MPISTDRVNDRQLSMSTLDVNMRNVSNTEYCDVLYSVLNNSTVCRPPSSH